MKSVVLCVWGRVAQDWLQSSTEEPDEVSCVYGEGLHKIGYSLPQRNKIK